MQICIHTDIHISKYTFLSTQIYLQAKILSCTHTYIQANIHSYIHTSKGTFIDTSQLTFKLYTLSVTNQISVDTLKYNTYMVWKVWWSISYMVKFGTCM